jgi:hypothetical protein
MSLWSARPYLIPVPAGKCYEVDSPPWNALVTRELAAQLQRVLERFAVEAGATGSRRVRIHFEPGIVGHHQVGRAADIYRINGRRMDAWRAEWERAAPEGRARNLGWRLYRALAKYGRWAQPPGYPVQLFGPWTREEGPWKRISDGLLAAHRDHIHIAL